MATTTQIEANRRNSQKSTGPRSIAGKALSSMNALKSGIDAKSEIIRGEDPNLLDLLKASYYESLHPARPEEAVFVDAIISADWLLRRLRKPRRKPGSAPSRNRMIGPKGTKRT